MKATSRVAVGTSPSTFAAILLLLVLGVAVLVLVPAAEAKPILSAIRTSSERGKGRTTRDVKRTRRRNHRRGRKLETLKMTTSTATTTTAAEEDSMTPLAGGYRPVPAFKNDAIVTEAAAFCLRELLSPSSPYSIVASNSNSMVSKDNGDVVDFEILRASQQVVAGLNIRLDLVFRDSAGVCVGAGTVVVYNHFGDLSITSWKTNDNGDESLAMCQDKVAAPAADTASSTSTSTSSDTGDNENDVVVLEDFSNPMHDWGEMNDPVMGGKSIGTFHIENGSGRFVGEVVDVPFLQAPGFIKGHTTDHNVFPDVSSCQALQLVAKSNVDYAGYRISFGRAHAPGGKFFAFGYKANIKLTTGSVGDGVAFETVTIPFSQFTDFWDDATGESIHTCAEDSRFCPDEMTLKNLQLLELWGEGVGGVVDLEIHRIQAVGCNSDLS